MSDFSRDFDARSVGWWQRRSVIRQIKRTSWLTAADRNLRVERARAAHTRGELNALTRDLNLGAAALSPQPAWTPPPAQSYGSVPPVHQAAAPPSLNAPRKRNLRSPLLIGGVFLLLTCGGGLVSCVSAIVSSVSDISSPVSPPDDLMTSDGWATMVADLDDSIDVEATVEAVVRRRSVTIALAEGGDTVSRYYYDGDVTQTSAAARNPALSEFDLALIEGELVARAVARARQGANVDSLSEAIVNVSAAAKDKPTLTVTIPARPGYSVVVDIDGSIVSENGVS